MKIAATLWAGLLAMAFAMAGCASFNKNNAALGLIELGKNEQAIELLDEYIGDNPDLTYAFSNRGVAKVNLHKFDSALDDFDTALRIDPRLALAHHNRGWVLLLLNRPKEALESLNQAIATYGDTVQLKSFTKVYIQFYTSLAPTYSFRSIAWYKLGEFDQSIRDAEKALELDPDTIEAYVTRGSVYLLQRNDPEEAEADFREALRRGSEKAKGSDAETASRYAGYLLHSMKSHREGDSYCRIWAADCQKGNPQACAAIAILC